MSTVKGKLSRVVSVETEAKKAVAELKKGGVKDAKYKKTGAGFHIEWTPAKPKAKGKGKEEKEEEESPEL